MRVKPTDFSSTTRLLRFVVAIEMVYIGTLGLIFPCDFGIWVSSRKENLSVVRPSGQVRATAAVLPIAIRCRKPHGLAGREDAVLRTVCFADANVRPIMPLILTVVAVNV